MQDRVFKTIYLGDDIECMAQVFFTTDYDAPDASAGCAGGHGAYASIADAVVEDVLHSRDELAEMFGKADVTRAERIIEAQLTETLNDGESIIDDEGAEFDPADYAAPTTQIAAE
ncbi:hypothetical protein VWZ82_12875 [Phaeobacter sp. JH20_41]|uniref:hypothetical protein n=1 Tax=Phaeobacter sp. JH20_41 TaxID=3112498 RepID=UPI003A88C995